MSRIIKHMVGDIEVIALQDGTGKFGAEVFPDTGIAEIERLQAAAGHSEILTNFNAFVIRSGAEITLVDAGPRELFGPTAGFLPEALAEAGISPAEITRIFFTHLHPDHVAGAITKQGARVFENAEILVDEGERGLWSDPANFASAGEAAQQFQQLAAQVLTSYGDRVTSFSGVADIGAGLTSLPLPGHTLGHSGIRISSGTAQFVIAGDIVHAQALQLANPDIGVVYDMDGAEAAKQRKSLLDMLATDGIAFSGGHILHPAIGRVTRQGDGYGFEAI